MSDLPARVECSAYLATLERARAELEEMLRSVNEAIERLERHRQPSSAERAALRKWWREFSSHPPDGPEAA